jgi:DNA repair protein RadA/Sms
MAKARTHFSCQSCGFQSAKWLGRCPDCSGWNTLVEEAAPLEDRRPAWGASGVSARPVKLVDVEAEAEERRRTGIGELDRVLGGGVVPGSLVLLGGDPGIGSWAALPARSARCARSPAG